MKSRLLTAAVAIPPTILIFILGEFFHWIMYGIVAVLCLFMVNELLSARKLHNNFTIMLPCSIFAVVQPILLLWDFGLMPLYGFLILCFLSMIVFHKDLSFNDVAFSALGTIVIVWGMSSILMLPPLYGNRFTFFFVLCIGMPWCADAGAYFAGVFLGKHKLCPNISPNKTVEGLIGGIIVGTLSCALIGFVFTYIYSGCEFNYLVLIITGFIASYISVLGDLTFSLIKRSSGIKDYGSIFPGHGGFLDRFDSVLFAAPLIYFIGMNVEFFKF